MRASVLLVVVLGVFACSQAEVDLKEVGTSLVNTLVDQVKTKLVDVGKNLLSSLLEKFGKRHEVSSTLADFLGGIFKKVLGAVDHAKGTATSAFGKTMDKLRGIVGKFHEKLGLNSDAKKVNDEVDDVVAEHHVQQKRFLADLFQKVKDVFNGAVAKGKELLGSLKEKASAVASDLLQKGTNVLVGKRATLSDHLQSIGGAISSAVSPFKDIVAGLGNTLKGHFSNLIDTVKGHAAALKDKLSGHVDDLKTHGKTLLSHGQKALGALGAVVSDILKQTLTDAGPAIDGLAKTAAGAGQTVVDHFTGADKPSF